MNIRRLGATLLVCTVASPALAQSVTSDPAATSTEGVPVPAFSMDAAERAAQPASGPPRLSIGSFLLMPELRLSMTYDDNIYADRRDEARDMVFTLSPSLAIESDWVRHALNFTTGADIDRYRDYSDEDVEDYWLGFDGRFDLTEQTNIFGGARHTRDHEDRFAPGALSPSVQREPTQYDHREAHLGIATEVDSWRIRAGGTYDQFDFQDGRTVSGSTIDNDDRDYTMRSLGIRVGYPLASGHEVFAQYATDQRDYDQTLPGTAFDRGSDGYRAAVGLNFRAPQQELSGEVFAGVLRQDFDHHDFSRISSPYFGALVVWRPLQTVAVTGYVDRSLEETTVYQDGTYASSSLDTTWGVELERGLSERVMASARLAYTRSDYQDFDRLDEVLDAGAGLRYYVSPSVFLSGDLRLLDRRSDDIDARYTRNQIMFSIGYVPGARRNPLLGESRLALVDGPAALVPGGPYAGVALGFGAVNTVTSGARGGGGSYRAEMGDSGVGGSLFLGYDFVRDGWHFGPEIELEDSRAEWSHRKDKDGSRTSSVEKDRGYGLGLRIGYMVDNGVLLYSRLSAVRSRFSTYYTQNEFPEGAFDRSETLSGKRLGIGVDIPAGARTFTRLEYVYSDYGREDLTYLNPNPSVERFETRDAQFRLGIGWRFGAGTTTTPVRPAVTGFYAGVHTGHGSLDSRLDGRHTDQGAPRLSIPFSGEFGDMGSLLGLYAGYGRNFGRWYGGVEVEADSARIGWRHDRETKGSGGRDFSVDKKSDYGIALRAGYSLHNGTLLYARVGPVRGRFETTWIKGGNVAAHIDRSDMLNGLRFGLGAEVPLAGETFVRLDYTRTRYDTVRFTTIHANPDQMAISNRNNLFRVGLGVRF